MAEIADVLQVLDVTAEENEDKLGLTPAGWPPDEMVVKNVEPGFWADRSGVQVGDIVTSVNRTPLADLEKNEIIAALKKKPVSITFSRWLARPTFTADEDVEKLGMQPGNWPPGWVYINKVEPDCWANLQGIQIGWAIVAVNGIRVETMDMSTFRRLLKARPVSLAMSTPAFQEYKPPSVVSSPGLRFSIIPGQPLDISPFLANVGQSMNEKLSVEVARSDLDKQKSDAKSNQVEVKREQDFPRQNDSVQERTGDAITKSKTDQREISTAPQVATRSGQLVASKPTVGLSTSVMGGWLQKRGPTASYKWLKRWCVLYEDSVVFYADDQLSDRKGVVHLKLVSRISTFSSSLCPAEGMKHRIDRPYGFVLDPDPSAGKRRKLYYFDAGSPESLESWTQAFEQAKSGLKASMGQVNTCLRSLLYSGMLGK